MLLCLNNMKVLPILIWIYLLKLSNLKLVQTQIIAVNDEQLVKKNKKLKKKLANSEDDYKSLLAKMKTMCKHCGELTNKVANLEAIGTTLTKAHKKKSSIFDMPKKDASTSYNDLCLDSPLCNQVCVEKVVVDTCTRGCKGK